MQYHINSQGLTLGKLEKEAIDAKIGLSLGRFTNLISECELSFAQDQQVTSTIYSCSMRVVLKNNVDFIVSDFGKTKIDAFRSALERIKRNIERHLKRQNMVRNTNKFNANRLS